jgi:hypothetical protein
MVHSLSADGLIVVGKLLAVLIVPVGGTKFWQGQGSILLATRDKPTPLAIKL